jgi:hypothetical protein
MSLLGIHLTLLIGPIVPLPAPPTLAEALESVEVTHSDEGRSGFQLSFAVGRSGPLDLVDYPPLLGPHLRPFSRVVLVVRFGIMVRVLFDGVITHQQLSPKSEPGTSLLTVTGEDVSVMMDLKEQVREHPAQDETIIANKIIATYAQYQIVPTVIPPFAPDLPIPLERTPVQAQTDLKYLQTMAERFGYIFSVFPGPVPLTNIGYWGPPIRVGIPQKALTVNMGPETNVESIDFSYNALAPTTVTGQVQVPLIGALPIQTFASLRIPPLALMPALPFNYPNIRETVLNDTSGQSYIQAFARAQGMTDKSTDQVVSATGEVDALRYGDMLMPRALVGVRGAGFSYDGFYYVKSVSHSIKRGAYRQKFTLNREGTGTTTPFVIP